MPALSPTSGSTNMNDVQPPCRARAPHGPRRRRSARRASPRCSRSALSACQDRPRGHRLDRRRARLSSSATRSSWPRRRASSMSSSAALRRPRPASAPRGARIRQRSTCAPARAPDDPRAGGRPLSTQRRAYARAPCATRLPSMACRPARSASSLIARPIRPSPRRSGLASSGCKPRSRASARNGRTISAASTFPKDGWDNHAYWNLGCAYQANLARAGRRSASISCALAGNADRHLAAHEASSEDPQEPGSDNASTKRSHEDRTSAGN